MFGRRRAFPVLLLLVFGYMVLVGASASVVRAAIMGGLTRLFSADRARKVVGVLSDAVIVTLAAQITTLPVLVVTFRQISILTLLVNALVLPAQAGVMLFGGLALLAGSIWLPLGQTAGWVAWLFLTWTLQVIHLFALVPGVAIELGYVDPLWGVAYAALLAAATLWFSRSAEQRAELKARLRARASARLALPALGMIALLGAVALVGQPDGRLHIHALNVDGGPVFVQTPTGRQILIGGSNSPSALLAALGGRMPFWDRDIDLIVVPRADARSLNGLLAVVDRYRIGHILSVDVADNRASREWLDVIAARSIETLEVGSSISVDDGVVVTLDEGGWAHIAAGGTSIGTGMPNQQSRADVVFLDHASDEIAEWIKLIRPQIIVAQELLDAEFAPEGVALIVANTYAVELVFDGVQWMIQESH